MNFYFLYIMNIFPFNNSFRKYIHFFFQPGRKYCKPHHFYQSNIFFFNVMQFFLWMIPARML